MRSIFNAKMGLIGALLAGIGASACCLGPLLLLSLGVSGAWIGHLTALEPYRPVWIILTIVLLGLSFRRLYLTPSACAPGDSCTPASRKLQRILFWVLLPVVVLLLISPWVLPFFYR